MEPKGSKDLCGAKRKNGEPCKRRAGCGTEHLGRGPCDLHGGHLPTVVRYHARAEALDFAIGALGAEGVNDALDGLLHSVGLARGLVDYWRREIKQAEKPTSAHIEGYERSLKMLNHFSKGAADANVAEKLIAIAARQADAIALAVEEALVVVPIPDEHKQRFLVVLEGSLAKQEQDPFVEGTARELPEVV